MTDEMRAAAPAALASGVVFAIVPFVIAAGWASEALTECARALASSRPAV